MIIEFYSNKLNKMPIQLDTASRNPRIDSSRGWGCLLILVLHSFAPYLIDRSPIFAESDASNLGTNIVSLFFCISGYLVYQSIDSLSTHHQRYKLIFYTRRFFRIIPIWWFLVFFMYSCGYFSGSIFFSQFFFYFGFLSYMPSYLPIVPAWSLFVEENFYIILPWIHSLMNSLTKVSIALVLSIIFCILWKNAAPYFGVPTSNYFISRNIIFKMPFFISGVFLFNLEKSSTYSKYQFLIKNRVAMSALGLISFIALFHHYYIYALASVPLLCFVCINSHNIFSYTEHSRFLKYIGARCYSIYIFHAPINTLTQKLQYHLKTILGVNDVNLYWLSIHTLLIITLTIIASSLTYYWIEQPCLRWGYALSNRWKKKETPSLSQISTF